MTKRLSILVLLVLAALLTTGGVLSATADGYDFSAYFYSDAGTYGSSISYEFTLERDCLVTFSLTNTADYGHSVNYTARISYISGAPSASSYNYNYAYCGDTITVDMALAAGRHTVQVYKSTSYVGYTLSLYGNYAPELDKTDIYPAVGEKIPLKIVYQHDLTAVWSSDAPKTASVTAGGTVKGLKAGSTVIRCLLSDGTELKCNVTVPTLGKKVTVHVGDTVDLSVGANGEPCAWSGQTLKYSSSDKKVATVSAEGLVTAKGMGTATISMTVNGGKPVTKTVKVILIPKLDKSILYLTKAQTSTIGIINQDTLTAKWSTDNKKIATVTKGGVVKGVKDGSTVIRCVLSDGTELKCDVHVVSFAPSKVTVHIGSTADLTRNASGTPYAWTSIGAKLKWKSSNKKVATVSSDGVVKGLKAGTAEISVTIGGAVTLTKTVRVTPVPTLSEARWYLLKGSSFTLKIKDQDGLKAKWSSDNTSVATVTSKGVVKAKGIGKTVIRCTLSDGTALSCWIGVFTPGAAKLTLNVGETYDLYYYKGYQAYVWDEEDDTVKWSSSDKKIVSVDQYGEIKAVKAGTAKISVTLAGKQTFVLSTVRVKPILDQTELVLTKGEKATLKVKGTDGKITWSSSDTAVATVKDGVVTAVKNGNATITAKVGEDTLKCAVSVKPILTIEVLKITDTSIYNEVYVTFHNNSNKKIVYTKLNIYQYNNAGTKLRSPYSYYYLNETIPAKGEISYWEYWVHDDTKKVKIEITEVTFADGTKWRP